MSVFSRPFISIQGLESSSAPVVVPDGHVYIVKQLTFYSSPTVGQASGNFRDVGSGATLFAGTAQPFERTWQGFYGAIAFLPGESFQWEAHVSPTDGVDVYAGGYDLLTS